jgi:hypothetical protein
MLRRRSRAKLALPWAENSRYSGEGLAAAIPPEPRCLVGLTPTM